MKKPRIVCRYLNAESVKKVRQRAKRWQKKSSVFNDFNDLLNILVLESLKPLITSVKENVTSYMDDRDLSLVIGGHIHAPSGHRVTITCPVSGTPNPKVTWLFNHHVLKEINILSATGVATFTLDRLKFKNSGTYTCRAENILGWAEATTNIHVGE